MQAASDGNGDDFIVVRRKNGGKLADALRVTTFGEADKEFSADAKDITAFESSWNRTAFELSKPGESMSERLSLAPASFRSDQQYHCQCIHIDSGMVDKDIDRNSRLDAIRNDVVTQFADHILEGR